MTKPDSPGLRRVRAVLAAFGATPMTAQRIAELAHVSVWTLRNHYKRILLADNTMHVADWEHYGYGFAQRFSSGPGETPPRPKAPPPKVATAAWKQRTGYVDPRYAHRRLARPRDKALAALMGIRA